MAPPAFPAALVKQRSLSLIMCLYGDNLRESFSRVAAQNDVITSQWFLWPGFRFDQMTLSVAW